MSVDRPWTLTLRQYEQAIMDAWFAENPGAISKAEYLRCYPKGSRKLEWWTELISAARRETIPHRVLDDLFRRDERGGWTILSIMQAAEVDHTYLPPQTRAANAARQKEDREMRRSVRARRDAEAPTNAA